MKWFFASQSEVIFSTVYRLSLFYVRMNDIKEIFLIFSTGYKARSESIGFILRDFWDFVFEEEYLWFQVRQIEWRGGVIGRANREEHRFDEEQGECQWDRCTRDSWRGRPTQQSAEDRSQQGWRGVGINKHRHSHIWRQSLLTQIYSWMSFLEISWREFENLNYRVFRIDRYELERALRASLEEEKRRERMQPNKKGTHL